MVFLYQWLCWMCAFFPVSGQVLLGAAHGTTRQPTQPGRLNRHVHTVSQGFGSNNARTPEPRQATQLGSRGHSPRMMTIMPEYTISNFPSTQATMSPGIQRSSLGSPHPYNTNRNNPRHRVLGVSMQTTPSPRLKIIQSVSGMVRNEFVPPAQQRIPIKRSDQPSRSVTSNSPFHQVVNSRGTQISQPPSSNSPQNGQFSSRSLSAGVKQTRAFDNLQNARIQQRVQQPGKGHAHTALQTGNSNQHPFSSRTGSPRTPSDVSPNPPFQKHVSRVTSSRLAKNPQHQPSRGMKTVTMSLLQALQGSSLAPQNAPQNRIENAQTPSSVVLHNQLAPKNVVPNTKRHGQTSSTKIQNQSGHQLSTPSNTGHVQTSSSNAVQNSPVQHVSSRTQTLSSVNQKQFNPRHVSPQKIIHTNNRLHSMSSQSQQLVNSRGSKTLQTGSSDTVQNGPFSSRILPGGMKQTHVLNNLQSARIQHQIPQQGKEHAHTSPSNVLQTDGSIQHSTSPGIEPPQTLLSFLQTLPPTPPPVPRLRDVQTSSTVLQTSSVPQYDRSRKTDQVSHKVASSTNKNTPTSTYVAPQNLVTQTVTPGSIGQSQTSSTAFQKPPSPQHEAPLQNGRAQTLSNNFQSTPNPQKSTIKIEQTKTTPPYVLSNSHTPKHISPQGMEQRSKFLQNPHISNRLTSKGKSPQEISSSRLIRNHHIPPNQIKMEHSQTLSSNIIRKLPVYQNVAARRMEPRQSKNMLISSANIVDNIPSPQQESKRVMESRRTRPTQTSPSGAQHTSPPPSSPTPGVESTQKTSPDVLSNGRRGNVAPRGVENMLMSSSNIILNLPFNQQELPQKMKNTLISSANILRNLPIDQQVLPQRMKHTPISSANIVLYLPIDKRVPRRRTRHTQSSTSSNLQKPNVPKEEKYGGINNKQYSPPNTLSNVPVRQETVAKEIATVQTPSSQRRTTDTQQKQERQVKPNSQPGERANSNAQTTNREKQGGLQKAQPVPTIINGKKYMVNPLFIGLLKNYFKNAGVDMKTGQSKSINRKKTAQNINAINKNEIFHTKSQGKHNEIKVLDTQINNRGMGKEQRPLETTLATNVKQVQVLGESSVKRQNTQTQDRKATSVIDIGAHHSTKIPHAGYTTKASTRPHSSSLSKTTQPHTPYVRTIHATSTTTKPTPAMNTERMRVTYPPSSIPKPSQPQGVVKTTIPTTLKPPLPVTQTTTKAPKRRKPLLMPFRTSPVKQMITKPTAKPTTPLPNPFSRRVTNVSNASTSTILSQNLSTNTTRTAFTKEPTIHQNVAPTTRSTYPSITKVTTYPPTLTFQPSGGTKPVIDTPSKPETQLSNPINDPSSISNTTSTTKVIPSVKNTTPPASTVKTTRAVKSTTLPIVNKPQASGQSSNLPQKTSQKTKPKVTRKEQTTRPTVIPEKKPVKIQLGFELDHFRHTGVKSKKESNKKERNKKESNKIENNRLVDSNRLVGSEGLLFGDIFKHDTGLHHSKRTGVHKGFVGFNNYVNDVELLVLR